MPVYQAGDGGGTEDAQNFTVTGFDIPTNDSNTVALACIAITAGSGHDPMVSFGGTLMTRRAFAEGSGGFAQDLAVFSLTGPTLTSTNVVFSNDAGGGNEMSGIVVAYSDVELSDPFTATNIYGHENGSPPITTNIASAADELVVDFFGTRNETTNSTAGSGQTKRFGAISSTGGPAAGNSESGCSDEAGAASVTMSWTLARTDDYQHWVGSLQPPMNLVDIQGGASASPAASVPLSVTRECLSETRAGSAPRAGLRVDRFCSARTTSTATTRAALLSITEIPGARTTGHALARVSQPVPLAPHLLFARTVGGVALRLGFATPPPGGDTLELDARTTGSSRSTSTLSVSLSPVGRTSAGSRGQTTLSVTRACAARAVASPTQRAQASSAANVNATATGSARARATLSLTRSQAARVVAGARTSASSAITRGVVCSGVAGSLGQTTLSSTRACAARAVASPATRAQAQTSLVLDLDARTSARSDPRAQVSMDLAPRARGLAASVTRATLSPTRGVVSRTLGGAIPRAQVADSTAFLSLVGRTVGGVALRLGFATPPPTALTGAAVSGAQTRATASVSRSLSGSTVAGATSRAEVSVSVAGALTASLVAGAQTRATLSVSRSVLGSATSGAQTRASSTAVLVLTGRTVAGVALRLQPVVPPAPTTVELVGRVVATSRGRASVGVGIIELFARLVVTPMVGVPVVPPVVMGLEGRSRGHSITRATLSAPITLPLQGVSLGGSIARATGARTVGLPARVVCTSGVVPVVRYLRLVEARTTGITISTTVFGAFITFQGARTTGHSITRASSTSVLGMQARARAVPIPRGDLDLSRLISARALAAPLSTARSGPLLSLFGRVVTHVTSRVRPSPMSRRRGVLRGEIRSPVGALKGEIRGPGIVRGEFVSAGPKFGGGSPPMQGPPSP